jgi:hypothetical protein
VCGEWNSGAGRHKITQVACGPGEKNEKCLSGAALNFSNFSCVSPESVSARIELISGAARYRLNYSVYFEKHAWRGMSPIYACSLITENALKAVRWR